MIENWWTETDTAILECLRSGGPMSPAGIARRTGMSEGEATAFLTALIGEGRVRLRLVGLGEQPAAPEQARPWDSPGDRSLGDEVPVRDVLTPSKEPGWGGQRHGVPAGGEVDRPYGR